MPRRRVGMTPVVIGAALSSCVMDVGETAEEENFGKARQAVGVHLSEYSWAQGAAAVPMGSAFDRFCFLTEVRGHFQGGAESVKVFQSSGSWFLGGSSRQSGVGARARCIPLDFLGRRSTYSTEFSWRQNSSATPMVPDDGLKTCLLTRVQGHFEGGAERVEVTRSNGFWWLGGGSRQQDVGAGARCVDAVPVAHSTFFTECEQESCSLFGCLPTVCLDAGPVNLFQAANIACGLGKMAGKFKGGGERVRVYIANDRWWLDGNTQQTGSVAASAYCMF
jgi:hypothetical protein